TLPGSTMCCGVGKSGSPTSRCSTSSRPATILKISRMPEGGTERAASVRRWTARRSVTGGDDREDQSRRSLRVVPHAVLGCRHPRPAADVLAGVQVAIELGERARADLEPDAVPGPEHVRGVPEVDVELVH